VPTLVEEHTSEKTKTSDHDSETNRGWSRYSRGQITDAAPTSSMATTHQQLPLSEIEAKN
jgi:hypothetical protein